MAQETVAQVPGQRKSALRKLLLLVVVMLLVAVAVNWKDINAIAHGRRTLKSVLYGKPFSTIGPTFRFPEPLGPEDAKVKVQILAQEGNSCHEALVGLWIGVADLEPERLRVEFGWRPAQPTEGSSETAQAPPELGCDAGVLVNGESKFELGEGEGKRIVYLLGPDPGGTASEGPEGQTGAPPRSHGWTLDDVAAIVNRAIDNEYGENPKLTGDAIEEAWTAASDRIPRVEENQTGPDGAA